MYYEVYIPAVDDDGFDVTVTVDAENWMSALKAGLERTGEGADAVRNVMCDIKDDNTIHVTDSTTQRVFKLEELSEEEYKTRQSEEDAAPDSDDDAETHDEPSDEAPVDDNDELTDESSDPLELDETVAEESEPDAPSIPDVPDEDDDTGQDEERGREESEVSVPTDDGEVQVGSSSQQELQQDQEPARVVDEKRSPSDRYKAADIGRKAEDDESLGESLIEDIFLEIPSIHEGDKPMEEVVDFVVDLAVERVGAESGSILFADVSGDELYFAAARGPKADEVMEFRVPMGQGIVGFCAREGVSLAIGDAQEDPRFYKEISESIGYDTQSLLCAPIQYQGRVYGAIELVNKDGRSAFNSEEMDALAYMGRQLAEYVNRVVMSQESIADED